MRTSSTDFRLAVVASRTSAVPKIGEDELVIIGNCRRAKLAAPGKLGVENCPLSYCLVGYPINQLCLTMVTLDSLLRLENLWPSDSGSNWKLGMLVSEERGKPEYPEKNLSEQGREPTTNLTHK